MGGPARFVVEANAGLGRDVVEGDGGRGESGEADYDAADLF